jgi:hypothetical protein
MAKDKWIQKAFKKIKSEGKEGKCTGKKYGSESCPPGSKAYNMAKNLRKINRKSAADGGRIGKANGGFSHVAGYSPVLGNNQFGYPSGGVPVRTPIQGGGAAQRGLGRAFMKGGKV